MAGILLPLTRRSTADHSAITLASTVERSNFSTDNGAETNTQTQCRRHEHWLERPPPVNPQVLRDRLREREAREQADNRSPAEVWLGDPPPWRSALAQSKGQQTMTTTPATKATEKTAITPVPVETLSQLATVGRFTIGQKKRIARVLVDGGMNRRKVSDVLGLSPSTVKKDVTAR